MIKLIGMRHNFRRRTRRESTSFGVRYDYRSVMHYGPTAFSKNGRPTIRPRQRGVRCHCYILTLYAWSFKCPLKNGKLSDKKVKACGREWNSLQNSFSITHLCFLWSHIRLELANEEVSVVWTEFRCSACTAEGAEGERANISFPQKLKSRE